MYSNEYWVLFIKEVLQMYKIVQKIGRAGGPRNRMQKQKEWNEKYGEGNWEVVYVYNNKIYTRKEALEKFYNKSYYEFLKNNPEIAEELCSMAKEIYNPHAEATGGVDLQCPAVHYALKKLGYSLKGKQRVAIGTWGTKYGMEYPSISYKLSPFRVPLWCDSSTSVEEFWQQNKYLGVKI